MSNLTYTVRSDYPRIFCKSTDKTTITTRTTTPGSWYEMWISDYTSRVNTLCGQTDLQVVGSSTILNYFFMLGLYGWIENDTDAHNKLLSAALYLANDESIWPSWQGTDARIYAVAMAHAYEFLRTGVITFSAANRKTVGQMCIDHANGVNWPTAANWFHGHSPGDYMGALCAACAVAGEYGTGYDFRTSATNIIDEALDMWYGASPTAPSRLEVVRYLYADGGTPEGGIYTRLANFEALWMLSCVSNAFVQNDETPESLQLNGVDYAPFTDEDWVQKLGEYILWWMRRGDGDMFPIHDCNYSYPWFHGDARRMMMVLLTHGGTWRKQLRWLRDTLHTEDVALGYAGTYSQSHDVAFWDPADTDNASLSPLATTPEIDKTRFFQPPGSFWHRNSWDYPNSCIINISADEWFAYCGHQHLNRGAIQISLKNDMVLIGTGCYRTYDDPSDYGGSHHRTYYQQSISKSGVPLIHKSGLTHTQYNDQGSRATYPSGLGGQLWKRRWTGSAWEYEPQSLSNLLTDDSGVGWRCATDTLVSDNDNYAFLHCDLRRAYCYEPDDYGTSSERVTVCETKDLVIKGESVWPIVLRVTRVVKTNTSYPVRQHFHSYRQWASSYPHGTSGDTRRFTANGYKNTGKCVIDLYNWQDYTCQVIGGGSSITGGFYSHQFDIDGVNYPPTLAAATRILPNIGMWRQDIISSIVRSEENIVTLILPMGASDTPQEYSWVDIEDWYGVKFQSSGHEYRIHKTEALAMLVGEDEEDDTTAPAAPTGLGATPGDTQVVLTWALNTEEDMASYKVYYREKV